MTAVCSSGVIADMFFWLSYELCSRLVEGHVRSSTIVHVLQDHSAPTGALSQAPKDGGVFSEYFSLTGLV